LVGHFNETTGELVRLDFRRRVTKQYLNGFRKTASKCTRNFFRTEQDERWNSDQLESVPVVKAAITTTNSAGGGDRVEFLRVAVT
jgi:hypothetical protein